MLLDSSITIPNLVPQRRLSVLNFTPKFGIGVFGFKHNYTKFNATEAPFYIKLHPKILKTFVAGVAYDSTICNSTNPNGDRRVSLQRDLDFDMANIGAHQIAHA